VRPARFLKPGRSAALEYLIKVCLSGFKKIEMSDKSLFTEFKPSVP